MTRIATLFSLILSLASACAALLLSVPNAARAFPAYAAKEKKPCSYCHVNAAGGGKRNAAGIWYKAHGLSLTGFKPGGGVKTGAGTKKPAKHAAAKPSAKAR